MRGIIVKPWVAPTFPLGVILATLIGNMLVWFDVAIFAFFAAQIAKTFFPAESSDLALLLTLGGFSASFLVRPLGSLVLGTYADRRGRKATLVLTMLLIGAGSLTIALMPPYASIGTLAPLSVFLSRLLQGFAAGGEYGASTAYLAELSAERRGFFSSLQSATQAVSGMLAAVFGFGLTGFLSLDALNDFGWRIPFLFGALLAPIGLYLRTAMPEIARQSSAPMESPLRLVMFRHWPSVLAGTGLVALGSTTTYFVSYLPSFAGNALGIRLDFVYACLFIAFSIQIVLTPWVGALSDCIDRPLIIGGACLALVLSIYAQVALLVAAPTKLTLFTVVVVISIIKSFYAAPLPAFLADLFPSQCRATGLAMSYNLGVMLFGGTAPLIMESLRQITGSNVAPGIYLMAIAGISLFSLFLARTILRNDS